MQNHGFRGTTKSRALSFQRSLMVSIHLRTTLSVPDLPLCLGVPKHRAPLAKGGGVPSTYQICLLRWIFTYVGQF